MPLPVSLVLSGDSRGAQSALNAVEAALGSSEAEARQLAKAFGDVDASATRLAAAQTQAKTATDAAKASLAAGEIGLEQYNKQLIDTKTQLSLVTSAHNEAVSGLKKSQAAFNDAIDGMGRTQQATGEARVGYMMLGQQAQDVAIMLQGGANIGTIIATQGGQVATAVQMMGGKMSGFAGFMAGPWGAAITVGIGVLVNLAMAMDDNASAADQAVEANNAFATAQSTIAGIVDKTTGALNTQNKALLLNAQLTAISLRAKAVEAKSNLASVMSKAETPSIWGAQAYGAGVDLRDFQARPVAKLLRDLQAQRIKPADAAKMAETIDLSGTGLKQTDVLQAVADYVLSVDGPIAAKDIEDVLGGKRAQVAGTKRPRSRGSKRNDAAALSEFSEDTAKKIAAIRDEFSDIPAAVQRSNKAMAELNDLTSDINAKKLLPNIKNQLLSDLAEAKVAIEDSLNKPFSDFMEAQRQGAEIDKLLLQGRVDEAEALKIVLQMQEQQGPLTKQQLGDVLATVEAERQRGMVLRDQRALIQANLDAVHDMRGALEQTVGDMLRGKFSIGAVANSLMNSYVNITSKKIVEAMFGDTLRELENQASGASKVEAAGVKMATSLNTTSKAVDAFADVVVRAGAKIASPAGSGSASASAWAMLDGPVSSGFSNEISKALDDMLAEFVTGTQDIVVTGDKRRASKESQTANLLVDMVSKISKDAGLPLPKELTGLFKSFLGNLETMLPQAMQGAMIGSMASSLVFGSKANAGGTIGGQLGGKLLGSVLGSFGGPVGSIAGSLLGNLVGGLFGGGAKWGTTVVGSGTAGGNNDEMKSGVSSASKSIGSALDRIAEALGGTVGGYNVSIGQMDGKWRVSTSGRTGKLENKYKDVTNFGKDGGESAFAFAIGDAIGDGAVQGISAAIQKALRSNPDVDKALKEALKVQEIEVLVDGIGGQIKKVFKDFERQAAERVRIAREYGFDVVKIEERNAADRLKLTKQLLDEQVGSLQDLINEMTSGSLFEGSAVEQRAKLLDQVAAAKAAADVGEEGAADRLAALLAQLNAASKAAFGTTGGFASDRTTILDAARDTIAKFNQRVEDAARGSDPALVTTNATLDEIAEQSARTLAELGVQSDYLAQIVAASRGAQFDALAGLARTSLPAS
jgi:hypothetical protein